MRITLTCCAAVSAALAATPARADAPAPYALPWQLRPAAAARVARLDVSAAAHGAEDARGAASATMLLVSVPVAPRVALVARAGVVHDRPPGATTTAAAVNPFVGVTWAPPPRPPWRAAMFAGVALPVGMGGGADPRTDPTAAAAARGIPVRSAMDNAMFAVDYATALGGVDVAYVRGGWTVQAEATVLQLARVRDAAPDAARTNATFGAHAGAFVTPWLSLGGELRYQRWLSTPAPVRADPSARDTLTFAAGPRLHLQPRRGTWVRPGVSYTWAADDPLAARGYRIVQLDVPVAF